MRGVKIAGLLRWANAKKERAMRCQCENAVCSDSNPQLHKAGGCHREAEIEARFYGMKSSICRVCYIVATLSGHEPENPVWLVER